MVLEMRDGDKSKLRDKGILKAVAYIIDIIAHTSWTSGNSQKSTAARSERNLAPSQLPPFR